MRGGGAQNQVMYFKKYILLCDFVYLHLKQFKKNYCLLLVHDTHGTEVYRADSTLVGARGCFMIIVLRVFII